MAIWSLTQERIERLKKQVGDKEEEYKSLTNTSSKQLWEKDLEEFLTEWRFQLDDEARRAKKSAHAGRRASAKLRIGGKGGAKKRKAGDSDGDSDFAVTKPKKGAAMHGKAKPSSAFEWMNKKVHSPPAKPKPASQSLISAFGQKPSEEAEDSKKAVALDGAPEDLPADQAGDGPGAAIKKAPTVPKGKGKAPVRKKISDDEDDDMFIEVAKEAKTKTAPGGRQPRAAARKPVKYANSASEDDVSDGGDDLLGDVSNMVRGIPKGTTTDGQKSLFLASASRPSSSSSHGLVSNSKPPRAVQQVPSDDEDDETDYKNLVPKDSPQKPAARNARAIVLSGDEDDSFGMAAPKAALKSTAAAKAKQEKAPAQKAKKPVTKEKQKPPSDLSPAAKAYAAKLAKGKDKLQAESEAPPAQSKLTAPKKTKTVGSEQDANVLANDILGDEDDEDDEEPIAPRAAARPSRRAATSKTKSKYVDDEDDEDDDEASDFDDGSD